ncbi:anti-sigma factor family protein [Acidimangrovimonas pyrenivorans]|uniref:Anti-sigma factor family protein n=1 Tax=Acidimangrovimonas pyrenivorans TaxID=2030798 RepID=A0ABV7AI11_9RHOB
MTPLSDEELLAYHAGALSEAEQAQVAARLAEDPAAQVRLADWAEQDAALAAAYGPVAEEPVPARLSAVIAGARRPGRGAGGAYLRIAAAVALLAIGAGGGWLARGPGAPLPGHSLAQAAADAYRTYAVEVVHPVEVRASDADHLTGWISKRLGHPIHAPAFDKLGYRLMGGRVLPGDTGAAALFMYENDAGRRVTLYVAPQGTKGDDTAFRFFSKGQDQGFWWTDGPFGYALVGDIRREDLRRIATAAYDQLT